MKKRDLLKHIEHVERATMFLGKRIQKTIEVTKHLANIIAYSEHPWINEKDIEDYIMLDKPLPKKEEAPEPPAEEPAEKHVLRKYNNLLDYLLDLVPTCENCRYFPRGSSPECKGCYHSSINWRLDMEGL